jgi:hypothetical protein
MTDTYNIGAYVQGPPSSPRVLVRHDDLLSVYASGVMAERGETREAYLSHYVFGYDLQQHYNANRNSGPVMRARAAVAG